MDGLDAGFIRFWDANNKNQKPGPSQCKANCFSNPWCVFWFILAPSPPENKKRVESLTLFWGFDSWGLDSCGFCCKVLFFSRLFRDSRNLFEDWGKSFATIFFHRLFFTNYEFHPHVLLKNNHPITKGIPPLPTGSMYGTFTDIYLHLPQKSTKHVGKCTIQKESQNYCSK